MRIFATNLEKRTDEVLRKLERLVDQLRNVYPEKTHGLVFVHIVADPETKVITWKCSDNSQMGASLMRGVLETFEDVEGELLQ